jgi:hypothetical protein
MSERWLIILVAVGAANAFAVDSRFKHAIAVHVLYAAAVVSTYLSQPVQLTWIVAEVSPAVFVGYDTLAWPADKRAAKAKRASRGRSPFAGRQDLRKRQGNELATRGLVSGAESR